ncbi:DUF4132 domain-containing protein [Clostridium sp. 19966]|uniref:DUF4132 domain-containing protein n=1 Tax=Clostridium sp. 19966 TaxID=2768166 RepID=UPI0028DF18E1|nr:DUF4132 domain-containing protein [Clostridium sp. 19966]MDT8717914.1 DUF4132 domain-containing protein [Clostridium sp. 19966]
MRTLEEHLKERIEKVAESLGIKVNEEPSLQQYLDDNCEEKEFLNKIKNLDLNSLNNTDRTNLRVCYDSIARHENKEYMDKFIKILVAADEKNTIIILKTWKYSFSEKVIEQLIRCNANPAVVISYFAEEVQSREHSINMDNLNIFKRLHEKYSEFFKEAFKLSQVNARYYLSVVLAKIDADRYKENLEFLEKDTYDSLNVLLNDNSSYKNDLDKLKEYIKYGNMELEKILKVLKANINDKDLSKYVLKLLTFAAYNLMGKSLILKRFMKVMINLFYKQTFNVLYDLIYNTHKGKDNIQIEIEAIVKELEIPEEYMIAWMGTREGYNISEFNRVLELKAKTNEEVFNRAINLAGRAKANYLISLLWKSGKGGSYIMQVEDSFYDEFSQFLLSYSIPQSTINDFSDYLKGNKEFEDICLQAKNVMKSMKGYIYNRGNHLDTLFKLKGNSPVFERGVKLYEAFQKYELLRNLVNKLKGNLPNSTSVENLAKTMKLYGMSQRTIVFYFAEDIVNTYYSQGINEEKLLLKKIASEDFDLTANIIDDLSANARAEVIGILYETGNDKVKEIMLKYIQDTSKVVREKLIELFSKNEEYIAEVAPLLKAKKQSVRETVVEILRRYDIEKVEGLLKEALKAEKSEKVKAIIAKALNLEGNASSGKENVTIEDYCKTVMKRGSKASIKWLDFETLPKLKFKDSDAECSEDIAMALLIAYSSEGLIAVNKDAKFICSKLKESDVAEFAFEVLSRWLENGAEAKKKWVLAFSSVHGDYKVVELLKKNIEEWPLKARGAIASEAVKALALNGSDGALMIVDGISRKFKFKQVKAAAGEALSFAAKEIGITEEELSDKIVPNLDFDESGERVFDFGERKFTVTLSPELTLEIFDENNKALKKLPQPSKKDDEGKAASAQEEFKLLKKQLKSTISIQGARLEEALSSTRLWTKEKWTKLFVKNPIMHKFAMSLVWGTYEDNKLKETFRYMEDGSYNTKDEEEYELQGDALIGLVHPIELSEEDLQLWKEQLENYEIKQPFLQIERPIYIIEETEKSSKNIERFGGIIINSLSLTGKLTSAGWYRGSVLDAGGYYDFYKEFNNFNIGVNLEFSGTFVGCEGEDVTIYEATFYKTGTVDRGSYVYSSIKEEYRVNPIDVPIRLFSEIMYSIDRALSAKIGVDEKWKEKKI